MSSSIHFGSAPQASADYRGWFVGHFVGAPGDLTHSENLEVKWGRHRAGEARTEWAGGSDAHSLALLIYGRFRLRFPEREQLLENEGDFVIWEPGTPHTWRAEEDSLVITIRWPSSGTPSAPLPP